jgi:hypothetical protein
MTPVAPQLNLKQGSEKPDKVCFKHGLSLRPFVAPKHVYFFDARPSVRLHYGVNYDKTVNRRGNDICSMRFYRQVYRIFPPEINIRLFAFKYEHKVSQLLKFNRIAFPKTTLLF